MAYRNFFSSAKTAGLRQWTTPPWWQGEDQLLYQKSRGRGIAWQVQLCFHMLGDTWIISWYWDFLNFWGTISNFLRISYQSLTYNGHPFIIRISNIADKRLICFAVTVLLMIIHICSECYFGRGSIIFCPVAKNPMIPTIPGPRSVKIT